MTRNIDRAAKGISVIILFVRRNAVLEIVRGIKRVVAYELIDVAVESVGAGLSLYFHSARAVTTVLSSVVRSEDAKFGNRFQARVNVQRGVASVIHVVATIQFPVVVLDTAAVDAEANVAINSDRAFVLTRLVADTWNQRHQLSEVAAVQFQLCDLFPGYHAGQIRRLGFHLGNLFAADHNLGIRGTNNQRNVHAGFLTDIQLYRFGRKGLESRSRNADVVGTSAKAGNQVLAISVRGGLAVNPLGRVANRDFRAVYDCSRVVPYCTCDLAGGLCENRDRNHHNREEHRATHEKSFHAEYSLCLEWRL